MKNKILAMLKENEDTFVSGQLISEILGVSRASIWKYINKLKDEGYEIESISKNGYKLISCPDLLVEQEINTYLNTKYIGRNIVYFHSIDSTNTKAKEIGRLDIIDGTVVISEEQTAGRGRVGRQWISPKYKGIWMSIILKPDMEPSNASNITLIAAAAVTKALKDFDVDVQIKWPNDIILKNKKLGGILTEMSSELNLIEYIIIGIGINVNNSEEDFSDTLEKIATSLKIETAENFNRQKLIGSILNHFETLYEEYIFESNLASTIQVCKKNSILLGKEIQLYHKGVLITATAVDISDEGLLLIQHKDGSVEKIISGEVSMHGLYGYNHKL